MLVGLRADVHCSMNTGAWLFRIDLSGRDLNALAPASVAVLNGEEIASQNHCHSLEWIAMPRHGFAGSVVILFIVGADLAFRLDPTTKKA